MPIDRERLDPRLILKATPPKAAKTVLPRPRLSLSSPEMTEASVVAFSASPGFGKTALLAQWRREAITAGAAVAWLTIDAGDDPRRLVEGLTVAMHIGTGRTLPDHGSQAVDDYATPFEGISRWLAQVAAFAGDTLLILDDVHALPESSHGALDYLVHHAPANLRVVLASRKAPPFAVSALMGRGQFASVSADMLRLQGPETAAVLHARLGSRIDADTCARLHDLTEGWALGLQLLIASVSKQPSMRDAVANFMARSGDMHRFFVESLVQRLDPADSEFLTAVSFVDALHPDLCRAITGRDDSALVLERLSELTPFLTQGVASAWLRIHALAKEFLNEGFDALPAAAQKSYRRAAAIWLAEHRFDEEAARHALRAGEDELAVELAERSLYEVFLTGQVSRIAHWIDHLPPARLARRPRLRVALGWILAQSDRHAEAAQIVSPIIDDPVAEAADRFESIQVAATAQVYGDRPDAARALLAPWRERTSGYNPAQRLASANFDAYFALHQGAPEQARFLLTQPSTQGSNAGRYATGWRDWLLATSYLWQGQVIPAEESLRMSLAEVEPVAGRRSPVASMLASTLAAVLWERNSLGEIEGLLADRRDVIEQHATPDAIALHYIVAARSAANSDAMRIAYDLLERLYALGKARSMPRLSVMSLCEQMRLSALQGRERSCALTEDRLDEVLAPLPAPGWGIFQSFVGVHAGIARAYLHVSRKDWGAVRAVLAQTRPLAEQLRRNKDLLQIHLLDTLAARHCGDETDTMFREGLLIIEALGLSRLLADTHPELEDWARSQRNDQGVSQRSPAAGTAPASAPHSDRPAESSTVAPSLLLTARERDVIRLLANNLSNKEIASALDLSIQTVKWHLKNLFEKLDAGSRKHLVDRARMMGIISE